MEAAVLIREAALAGVDGVRDLRLAAGRVAEIGLRLARCGDEPVVEAGGGLLLPGLHDHHLHLRALAAALESLSCGPPAVDGAEQLCRQLAALERDRRLDDADGWIRGVGYHESVAGPIDRDWLDRVMPSRPLRIQHRSGRLWILNSAALARLGLQDTAPPGADPFERVHGRLSGRLYDADGWLRERLGSVAPSLRRASLALARRGVTAVTDTSPGNGPEELRGFAEAQQRQELLQDVQAMGDARLHAHSGLPRVTRGALKFHLHEHELPEFEACVAAIRASHASQRACAFHCVTRAELAFALTALQEAGSLPGDRIEHAGIAPPEWVEAMRVLGVSVATQPGFIAERGDAYLADVAAEDLPWLYRLRGLMQAGIPLLLSTDAPYTAADPWAAMQAAVDRRSRAGRVIAAHEALTPEQALAGFLTTAEATVRTGAPADLCLLDRGWAQARQALAAVGVRLTLRGGLPIWDAAADGMGD